MPACECRIKGSFRLPFKQRPKFDESELKGGIDAKDLPTKIFVPKPKTKLLKD